MDCRVGTLFLEHIFYRADRRQDARSLVRNVDRLSVLAVDHLLERLDILHGEHVCRRVGLRFLDGIGYAAYSLRLAFSLQYFGARFALSFKDFRLLCRLRLVDARLALTFGTED